MPFATSPQPRESLWGVIETAEQVLPGIWRVETSTHGGLVLSDDRQAAMPDALDTMSGAAGWMSAVSSPTSTGPSTNEDSSAIDS